MPPTNPLTCFTNAPNCGGGEAEIQFPVVAGNSYFVQVGSRNVSAPNSGAVNIRVLSPPPNDECVNASPLGAGTITGSTLGATTSQQTGSCGSMGSEIWYAFTVPCSGGRLLIDTCGSAFDTSIAVFSGCPGVQLGCNDDAVASGPCAPSLDSYVELDGLTAGRLIYIAVGGFLGQKGTFQLNVSCDYVHRWTVPLGAGSLRLENVNGPANAFAFSAITLDILHPGLPPSMSFPNGWFFGVPMGEDELLTQINWPGFLPFAGFLDGTGYLLNFTLPAGTTSALAGAATVWSVGVALDPATGFTTIADVTPPKAFPL